MEQLDSRTAATTPFAAGPEHERLKRLVGSWKGPITTWFDPATPAHEAMMRARVDTLLGGRFVRIEYQSTMKGDPLAGEMILAFDPAKKLYTAFWMDSFHTGTAPMLSTGAPRPDGAISVLGGYDFGDQHWGWRTVIKQDDDARILLEAVNIAPDGQEYPALEARLEPT